MESYLDSEHFDLVTPDGAIEKIKNLDPYHSEVWVKIKNISSSFVGYSIAPRLVFFNLKSVLAQLGVNGIGQEYLLSPKEKSAEVKVLLEALNERASKFLSLLSKGAYIGKLFAAAEERRVKNPDYLLRMFGRVDEEGRPLLSLGSAKGRDDLILEKIQGTTFAFLPLRHGKLTYSPGIDNFLETLEKALHHRSLKTRELLHLHQQWQEGAFRIVKEKEILLVRTAPLHIRTAFAKVAENFLPPGFHHTTASILQPDTFASGDIYEFFGSSREEIKEIPLEFYTLEPHREYVFFSDRDQLQASLEDPKALFQAFATAPSPKDSHASVFIVKGGQLKTLSEKDWIIRTPHKEDFPGISHPLRQALLVKKYIEQQPSYPFLKAIEENKITSEGILLCRHFPTPLLKRQLLSTLVQKRLKAIYFQYPSLSFDYYFSHEDRAFLVDLAKFGIPVFWVDETSGKILKYVMKPEKDTGMFVPLALEATFRKATFFGVYGSNLIEGNFEKELKKLLQGILEMRSSINHPLLNKDTPLALLTGGGPGAMEVGNRVAKELQILSCANIVDFRQKAQSIVNEQKPNPHVDAKMTFRLDRLVERQAEFHLDFPLFFMGGIGMDFEYTLEEVRRKTGAFPPYPILLFGEVNYWKEKITSRFQCNLRTETIKCSEWVSNCFYAIQKAEEGLTIYRNFFEGRLPIGKSGPIYNEGFCAHYQEKL